MNIKTSQIQVLDFTIDVVKKDIKNLHLSVYPPSGRVHISSPKDLNDEAIRLFAISKIRWIKKHQRKFYEQLREQPREYIDGESHYFEGSRYLLKVIEHNGKHYINIKNKTVLELFVNPNTSIERKQKVFLEWYRSHLKYIVPELILKWEKLLGVNCESWEVKRMRTQWGSCNTGSKKIILNLELAKKPRYCLEYIILHELVHLLERNHNDNFRAYLDKYMPNWKSIKDELNDFPVS